MHYKGEDMDLRVPHARSTRETYPAGEYEPGYNNGRWRVASGSTAAGTEPLWVDEVVLACCNTAYDMAVAHGSGDVGLEHLVHALTRVEAASRVVEALGVREGQLRRESAALMARDVAPTSERHTPRRSADVEDVLRRASEIASRRGVAASVEDLLSTLLHYGRDVPAIQLLRRMTPDWQRPDWGRGRDVASSVAEPVRYVAAPEPRYVPLEAPRAIPEPRYLAVDVPPRMDQVLQRLALIEDGMRAVHSELSADRKALGELVRDVQRDIVGNRSDAATMRNDLGQRLEQLERSISLRPDGRLGDRMTQLEKAVHNGLGEGARNWAALGQRLQTFEAALGTDGRGDAHMLPVLERVGKVEAAIDARIGDVGRGIASLSERLGAIERISEAGANERARRWTALSDRLGLIETRFGTDATGGGSTALTERIGGLERAVRSGFGETARQSATVLDRVGDIEKFIAQMPADPAEGALIIDERLQAIERRFGATLTEQAQFSGLIASRLEVIEKAALGSAEMDGHVESPLSDRIAGFEQALKATSAANEELLRARDREIGEMHDALVRLGENQHTLASAIADWRSENHDRLATITTHIDKLISPSVQGPALHPTSYSEPSPMPRVARPDASFDVRTDAARPTAEAAPDGAYADAALAEQPELVVRGRGFWWWLFGTDNVNRSNREVELRWARMHKRLQEARERRREQA